MKTKKISITKEVIERQQLRPGAVSSSGKQCPICGNVMVNLETFAEVLGVRLSEAFSAAVDGAVHFESTASGEMRICVMSIRTLLGQEKRLTGPGKERFGGNR